MMPLYGARSSLLGPLGGRGRLLHNPVQFQLCLSISEDLHGSAICPYKYVRISLSIEQIELFTIFSLM